jgi:cytochrome P450
MTFANHQTFAARPSPTFPSLLPHTDKANIAARYVALSAYAMDCLRSAREYRGDPSFSLRCNAQTASMER